MIRFWSKVNKTASCWLWTGAKGKWGHGSFQGSSAHRFAYKQLVGPIPDGMFVCHRCDVGSCVNPEHLFLGTQRDNIHDAINKGRFNPWVDAANKKRLKIGGQCMKGHTVTEKTLLKEKRSSRCLVCKQLKDRKRA